MSSSRLLILGVLRVREPIHGYDIRRELELWRAEQWANIAYGSIYCTLSKMSQEGLVKPVDTDPIAVDAARTLFAGRLVDPTVLRGFVVLIPLTLLALWWAVRSYRRAVS